MSTQALFSIRMRASKKISARPGRETGKGEMHISGAEGLYSRRQIRSVIDTYTKRAFNHSRGKPDRVVLTIEKIENRVGQIAALPVTTINCPTNSDAKSFTRRILKRAGVSDAASKTALSLLYAATSMRGASLILSGLGVRVEPDSERGVRVSRIGITGKAERSLALELKKYGLANETVREALIIASKVSSNSEILAEVCISDDPDYTTGYFSSRETGYVRIPNIKPKNSSAGGRVFFLKDTADITSVIEYLEKEPVLVKSISPCLGTVSPDEFIDRYNL